MQKTKLGVTVGLLGAALYFLGAISIICAFLLAGYVLLIEENEWLKKTAVKMMVIVITFALLQYGVVIIEDIVSILNAVFGWFAIVHIRVPLNLDIILTKAITIIENCLLIFMGLKAMTLNTVKVECFDKIVDKHM